MEKIFIGIDFSKEKVDVALLLAEDLVEKAERMFNEFPNTASGFKRLVKWVLKNSQDIDSEQWLFCGENTGGYSIGLSNFLSTNGFRMWLENAKSIKDASGIRRLKSDRADASMIAEYAMRNHDRALLYKPLGKPLTKLKELFLYRQMLVKEKRSFKIRRGEKLLTMESSHVKTLISLDSKHHIAELDKSIAKIDKEIDKTIADDNELTQTFNIVTSVPGIGTQNAVCLMVYTNNFSRFGFDSRKIACYYGIAPFGKDSGTSVHSDPHVHYMANRMIKSMLTQAALAAVNYNPRMRLYYQRLLAAGKKKPVALNNVKNKLLHWITAMVKNQNAYDKDYILAA